jgi:hypothetical protein
LFTWNIFPFGAEPKHGITASPTIETTLAYFRASVRELAIKYPLLAGIGSTAGDFRVGRVDIPALTTNVAANLTLARDGRPERSRPTLGRRQISRFANEPRPQTEGG